MADGDSNFCGSPYSMSKHTKALTPYLSLQFLRVENKHYTPPPACASNYLIPSMGLRASSSFILVPLFLYQSIIFSLSSVSVSGMEFVTHFNFLSFPI